uniref:Uncharacterized protein n=1 Tax=Arundo donax TaxID=35708 RepID=A0A0A8Z6R7_ARUDO
MQDLPHQIDKSRTKTYIPCKHNKDESLQDWEFMQSCKSI